ncbi:MAG: hypothetical protein LBH21_03810, partial [Gracilibacteraceae bacterium]|nr:hypothetical protein [Gracilibacteraceae bacterium]
MNIDTSRIRPGYAVHCHSKQESLQLKQAMNWNPDGSGSEAWKYLFPAAESRSGYMAVSFSTLLPRGTKILEFEDLLIGVPENDGLSVFDPKEPRTMAEFIGAEPDEPAADAELAAGSGVPRIPVIDSEGYALVIQEGETAATGAAAGPEVIRVDFGQAEARAAAEPAARPEPARPEQARPEVKPEAEARAATRPEAARPEAKPEPARPEAARPEVKPEPEARAAMRPEPPKPEVKPEVKPEPEARAAK